MKLKTLGLCGILALSASAHASDLSLALGTDYWNPTPTGSIDGTTTAYDDPSLWTFWADFRHGIPLLPNANLQRTSYDSSGFGLHNDLTAWDLALYYRLFDNDLFGIPWPLIYLLAVFVLFQFLLHHSRFGQHLQAVGGNRDMAQMSGLNVRRLTIMVWLLAGIAAGLAILPLLSQGSGSSSGTATPLLLETVLATFIGAAFSRRRVVTIWGALLGAVLVNALSNGLGLLGVNIFWMGAIKGGLILIVLAASAVRHQGGR